MVTILEDYDKLPPWNQSRSRRRTRSDNAIPRISKRDFLMISYRQHNRIIGIASIVGLVSVIWIIVAGRIGTSSSTSPIPQEWIISDKAIYQIEGALSRYKKDTGVHPTDEQGLNALVKNPGIPNWRGPYLSTIPMDGWGGSFRYHFRTNALDIESSEPECKTSFLLQYNTSSN